VSRAAATSKEKEPSRAPKPSALLPESGRFWIRYVPRLWESPEQPWVHLADGRLGEWGRAAAQKAAAGANAAFATLAEEPLDDVLYLPPVPTRRAAARDKLASSRLVDGTPVVIQLFPGEESTVPAVTGVAFVFELLPLLLNQDLDRLSRVPEGGAAVWALIPGLTDDPALWDEGCARLAAAGVRCVQAVAPALEPSDRRRLAERWGKDKDEKERDEVFETIFHREPPPERDFARVAWRHGLEPFLPRPLPRPPVLRIENRRLGGLLAQIAELWLRLERSEEQGQAFFRSARWIDGTHYDVEALAEEGNLGVLPLDPASRAVLAETLEADEPSLLAELREEYLKEPEEPVKESLEVTPDA
jgi:hypothetical protein